MCRMAARSAPGWLSKATLRSTRGRRSRRDVAGFVIAFSVNSRQGTWWEIDLLAVHPDRQGRGLGRQLIRAAAAGGDGPGQPVTGRSGDR